MVLLAPSILSADFANLAEDINKVAGLGADWLHIDVMDGHFVPNITIGPQVVRDLKQVSNLFFDVHLMIEKPEHMLKAFIDAGADLITVHVEASTHLHRLVHMIKDAGVKAGVALNPATPAVSIENILGDIDLVLVMSVNPGFGGQKFINSSIAKISKINEMLRAIDSPAYLQVDGGINQETGKLAVDAGASVLVAGSYIFGADDMAQAVQSLKNI